MFGLGKKATEYTSPKAKRKRGPVYWSIFLFVAVIEAMLGINAAFLVHESVVIVIDNLLVGTPVQGASAVITLTISLVFGACLICWRDGQMGTRLPIRNI